MGGQGRLLVIGATNRADRVDAALLRGGRLTRTIDIPLPDQHARLEILKVLAAPMPLDGIALGDIAAETEGFSGADLKALCQQAAVEAMIRTGQGPAAAAITPQDVAKALFVESSAVTTNSAARVADPPRSHRPLRAQDR